MAIHQSNISEISILERVQFYKIDLNRVIDFVDARSKPLIKLLMNGCKLSSEEARRMDENIDRFVKSQGEQNLLSKRDNRRKVYVEMVNKAINKYKNVK